MSVIVKKGEWLTHEDGTKYAVAINDIHSHATLLSSDFELAEGGKPSQHSPVPRDVLRSDGDGVIREANVNGVWRVLSEVNANG